MSSRARFKKESSFERRDQADRSLIQKELHLEKAVHSGCDLRVHLAYPNSYWVGMSNLGFQAVYNIFAKSPAVMIERGFFSESEDCKAPERNDFRSFESRRVLSDCDLLGFSLSFETDYPHVFKMLAAQGLLCASAEERESAADRNPMGHPLLIAGGTAVTLNPEPIADFFDVIAIGEAEELISEMVQVYRAAQARGARRLELLHDLAQVEGLYVPRFYKFEYGKTNEVRQIAAAPHVPARPKRRFVKDISKFPTYTRVLTSETEFSSMFLTETGRGCEVGCRFCVAGYIYRPVRKRSEESIAETVQIGLKNSKAIGFVGASVSSHRSIAKLASTVAQSGARASLSSLMSQKVSRELAASLSESEYKTVALAPEAGSERLRFAAGKRVKNSQVIEAAERLAEASISGFKLYFIVGLPTEEPSDVDAIAELALQIRDVVVKAAKGRHVWVALSVNPFIPKAWTPFQWEPMLRRKELENKIERVRKLIRGASNLELRFEPPKESYFQALLSRGDRRVGKLLQFIEEHNLDWKWLVQNGSKPILPDVPLVDFYALRRIPFEEQLPWEVIDSRIDRKLLLREALRAHAGGTEHEPLEEALPAELI